MLRPGSGRFEPIASCASNSTRRYSRSSCPSPHCPSVSAAVSGELLRFVLRARSSRGEDCRLRVMEADEALGQSVDIGPDVRMPLLGLGTWLITGREAYQAVRRALDIGYRHIDT